MYFKYCSRKNQREEVIHLSWQKNGWLIQHSLHSGLANTRGEPYIEQCFPDANYLEALGDAFEELWEAMRINNLDTKGAQSRLTAFSQWLERQAQT